MKVLAKYAAFARIGLVHALTERGELLGRALFFAVILGVFTALWRAIAEAGMPLKAAPWQLVWYLAATEWVFLSAPQLHIEMQEEIRRGDIACRLPRPVSYVGATFAYGVGTLAVRAPVLGATAFACAFFFTERVPSWLAFAYVVPFGLYAALLVLALYLLIGLLAFWLVDVTPVYWVWQKLLFVLGGFMLPLELFPTWIQRVGAFTPFPAMIAGPAGFMLGASAGSAATLLTRLSLWSGLVALIVIALFQRGIRRLEVGGG
jgi:ABC-2 type transport system permease protein